MPLTPSSAALMSIRQKWNRAAWRPTPWRGIIQRFCGGSVENLLVGMVDDEIVSPKKLRELAERIGSAEAETKRKRNPKGR